MKILHIIDSGGLYGAEIMLLNLVGEQIKLGLNPTIGSIGDRGSQEKPLEKAAREKGYRVHTFRMRPGPNIFGALEIRRFCLQNNFDVIHTHGYKGNILLGFIPKRLRKIPLVATIHGWTNPNRFNKMMLYQWLDRISFRFIDTVVAVNEAMLSHPKLINRKHLKIAVINNGISPLDFSTEAGTAKHTNLSGGSNHPATMLGREIIDFCRQGFAVGAIGRLSAEKGYDHLLEAVSLLSQKGYDIRLVIIGEGGQRAELEALAAKFGITDRVLMPGYKENAHLYLPCFSVFAISSFTEGLPITLLEAMQAGTPVVATKVGGIPFVLKDDETGILVQPFNSRDLAEGILKIHQNAALGKRLAATARQVVNREYTSAVMAEKYLKLYQSIINK